MMLARVLLAALILPGSVLVLIPASLLYTLPDAHWGPSPAGPVSLEFWLAFLAGLPGILLAISTVSLFLRVGQGTPAPWDPPQRFVVRGPYRYLRNPMITGVFLLLLAETLFFRSWPILIWLGVFVLGNAIYIPQVEEKRLTDRFGQDYRTYTEHVPRWIPRLTAWRPPEEAAG